MTEQLASTSVNVMDQGINLVGDTVNTAADTAVDVVGTVANTAGNVVGTVANTAGDVVGNVVGTAAGNVYQLLPNSFATSGEKLYNLMVDFNVIGFALGLIIVQNITELSNAFIEGMVMPSLKPWLDKFSEKNKEIHLFGFIHIHYDKFFAALIKFITLSVLLFIAINFGMNLAKPVQWVAVKQSVLQPK